jgi:hypothetical protein
MADHTEHFFRALKDPFDILAVRGNRYGIIIESTKAYIKFLHEARLEQEAYALSDPNPSRGRTEGILQSEQLADLESALQLLIEDMPSQSLIERLALAHLQKEEPDFYHRITRE